MENSADVAAAGAAVGLGVVMFGLVVLVAIFAGMWKIFAKAGKPGWASLVPIYNYIVMLEIARKPIWWVLLLLIPCVGVIFGFLVWMEICKKFGKGPGFVVGLFLLPLIFIPMLGFGKAQYNAEA